MWREEIKERTLKRYTTQFHPTSNSKYLYSSCKTVFILIEGQFYGVGYVFLFKHILYNVYYPNYLLDKFYFLEYNRIYSFILKLLYLTCKFF